MANKTSPHIIASAASLLGFCLIIYTSIHLSNRAANSFLDECALVISLLLTVSSILSLLSIRTQNNRWERLLESGAEIVFLLSLIGIFLVLISIAINL